MNILEEAEKLVGGDRQQDYGDTRKSFTRIAKLWSAYKHIKFTPQDVGLMMILLKVSRGAEGAKRDTIVDIAGYARCIEMLGEKRDGVEQVLSEWEAGNVWKLPSPPPGKQWHRDDWTQDMLPEGWRPLLKGECACIEDQWTKPSLNGTWMAMQYNEMAPSNIKTELNLHQRTRRPLPV